MLDLVQAKNARLRDRLDCLTRPRMGAGEAIDVVVTTNEINDLHGTGPMVKRVMKGGPPVFSLRTQSDWGFQDFGEWTAVLPQQGLMRAECSRNVTRVLTGHRVRNVLCVPYWPDELLTSIAVHDEYGAKICTWIMDDHNIVSRGIPDDLMRELLEKSALRLATHPELCRAYQHKFGFPFFVLPAVVPHKLVACGRIDGMVYDPGTRGRSRRGALLGSFWEQSSFDWLCSALERCDSQIDWYGNNHSRWIQFPEKDLARAGITVHGVVAEDRLAVELRRYPFVIVPVGTLDGAELQAGVARLSLPGRILFAASASNTPILIVGSEKTCGAHFVKHFGIGEVVPYDSDRVAAAMDRLSRPEIQEKMRANAVRIAPALSDQGISQWLAHSIRVGKPADQRFEDLFAEYGEELP